MKREKFQSEITDGWIKLYRKSLDSPVFKHEGLWKVWSWCLMKANHRETTWETTITGKGSTPVQVGRGQFVFGRKTASKELGMDPSTVYKRMLKLKKLGNLTIKSNSHYSIVTIVNWDFYQEEEEKVPGKVTGKCQASNTYKNVKNEILPIEQPKKQVDRPLTSIQELVEAYKTVKGFNDIPDWNKINFARFTKDAKNILLFVKGDVVVAVKGLKRIARKLNSKGLSWNLSTVVRMFPDWLIERSKEDYDDEADD